MLLRALNLFIELLTVKENNKMARIIKNNLSFLKHFSYE